MGSLKLYVQCGLISVGVTRPFFFHTVTVTGALCLDMIEECAVPQLPDKYIFSANGAPPHFWTPVTEFFNQQFTGMSIGQDDYILWSP
jgi:hypothetical protein